MPQRWTLPPLLAAATTLAIVVLVSTLTAQTAGPAPSRQRKLEGTGNALSAAITLPKGLLLVVGAYKGAAHFAVELLSSGTEANRLAVNVVGAYQGMRVFPIDGGQYRFRVKADRAWVLLYEPVNPTPHGETGPFNEKGTGDAVRGPVRLGPGRPTITSRYAGSGHFAVTMYRSTGEHIALISNAVGKYSGSTTARLTEAGDYWFDIKSSGAWSLALQP